ncbi:bifunctional diguanylate cyclase/phosphodiesterase [Gordoniibacillus kamchatkensis]|uniref:bifunctional diguanylate cyclase/phosphodiesterase n=1 Tax=Gordoniibacillus kamchatkensis TaxID=1590651 RepID=UPI0006968F33|nr:bifunctional diguanylate cyclase/phosphodiesterase [Paenibacillus sp. VKM B-2647]
MIEHLDDYLPSLFAYNPDPCYVLNIQGCFIGFNEAALKLTGYAHDELLGMHYPDLLTPYQKYDVHSAFRQVVTEGIKVDSEVTIYNKSKECIELSITAMPVRIDGRIAGLIGIAKDITRRNQLERTLLKTQAHLANIFESLEVCLWSRDAKTNETQISPACEAIYGYPQEAFVRDPDLWRKVIHPDDRPHVEKRQRLLLRGKKIRYKYRICRRDGTIRWVDDYTVPVPGPLGDIVRVDGVITDITERKKTEDRLYRLAFHDALTGLPNRRLIKDLLRTAISHAERKKQRVAVMYLDLDGFKFVNDSLDHALGDRVLQMFAKRLRRCVRAKDHVGRIGGDEFVVILEETTELVLAEVIIAIIKAIAKPFTIHKQEYTMTTSLGISFYPEHGGDGETLLNRADQAMYLAKENGKNKFETWGDDISCKLQRRVSLEQWLRKALQYGEFELHYHPIVNVATGSVIGTEALIRWHHRSGSISPLEFIPVAEQTGLIVPIGEWVLRTACAQNKLWQDQGFSSLFVSVNLSVRQLEQDHLIDTIRQILDETGLDPRFLHIEITESTAMTNVNQAIRMLKEMSDIGISISIDDFGTGYSSLSYLEKFPIHTIKIDQTFIRTGQLAIIRAIIAMARSLNLNVIAEGVENESQTVQLHELGCSDMQGFLFSLPVCPQELEPFLRCNYYTEATLAFE